MIDLVIGTTQDFKRNVTRLHFMVELSNEMLLDIDAEALTRDFDNKLCPFIRRGVINLLERNTIHPLVVGDSE